MDVIDEKILQELSGDGRLSNLELSEKISLSPSATSRRVNELERRGVIKGYRAIVDRDAIDIGFVAYVAVGISTHNKMGQEAFERAMEGAREVKECHNVAGSFEYLLRVETRDLKSYKSFHTDVLGTVRGVVSITSYIVMGSPKDLRS